MKLLTIYVFCYFLHSGLAFSQGVQETYTIQGAIHGIRDGQNIYLHQGMQIIDSTKVMGQTFQMKGRINEFAHTYLYLEKTTKLADILLDNRLVQVIGAAPQYDSISVLGSDIDMQWKQWFQEDIRLAMQPYRLRRILDSLLPKKDTILTKAIKQFTQEITEERKVLLKSYVKKYHDSPVGAILPNLCTLQKNLTQSDYLEMYNSLTLKMQNTIAGKEIQKMSGEKIK